MEKRTRNFTWNIKYTLLTLALSCFFVGLQLLLGVSDWSDIFYGPLVLLVTFPVAILWLGIYESLFEEKDENNEPQWEKKGLMVCVTGVFQVSCRLKLNFMPPAFLLFSPDLNLLHLSLTNLVTFLTSDLG